MAISYIDGNRLKKALVAGAEHVISQQEYLNKINVFPVPDGDTGSNMAVTFKSISDTAEQTHTNDISVLSNAVADSAMMNARGSSGAILAQFFLGLAGSLNGKTRVKREQFATAAMDAAKSARQAIMNPAKGTIITVMEDWANYLHKHHHKFESFETMLQKSLDVANTSVKDTKDKMEVLAKSDVVDAGAQGFALFLHGAVRYIKDGHSLRRFVNLKRRHKASDDLVDSGEHLDLANNAQDHQDGDVNFQFCTECLIAGDDLSVEEVKNKLSAWGDSQIVIGNDKRVKVHIHTNDPNRVFQLLQKMGTLEKSKADDMWLQFRRCIGKPDYAPIAIITDSSVNLPQETIVRDNILVLPHQICFEEETYIDRVNITHDLFYEKLANTHKKVSTAQGTPADFYNVFNKAKQQSRAAIGLFISGNFSGAYETARATAQQHKQIPIEIVDTGEAAAGLGFLVETARDAIQNGEGLYDVVDKVNFAKNHIATFIAPTTMKYLIQGGRVNKRIGKILSKLGLLPVLCLTKGKVKRAGIVRAKSGYDKIIKLATKYAKQYNHIRVGIAQVHAEEAAEKIAAQLQNLLNIEEVSILTCAPTIGAHTGPGTIGITIMGLDWEKDQAQK